MIWRLLTVSAGRESWSQEAQALYQKKLQGFCKFEIKEIKPKALSRETSLEKQKLESHELLSEVEGGDFIILFDERGKALSSEDFARLIQRAGESGKRRVQLIIGGAFGVSDQVRERAQNIVSLSGMILNHHVAQVVALEQFYRAWTIIKGIPYHNK